ESKAEIRRLTRERNEAVNSSTTIQERPRPCMKVLHKPKGEAGDRKNGFNLREAMGLEGEEGKTEYLAIVKSVRMLTIQACINLKNDFREVDPAKLAMVYEMTTKAQPYMTKKRFPNNWATAEIVKQYMKNHRRHAV
ncbi:hypothetical protein F5887DRAFT_869099, partial [Amanita rubescens]